MYSNTAMSFFLPVCQLQIYPGRVRTPESHLRGMSREKAPNVRIIFLADYRHSYPDKPSNLKIGRFYPDLWIPSKKSLKIPKKSKFIQNCF